MYTICLNSWPLSFLSLKLEAPFDGVMLTSNTFVSDAAYFLLY